jgi:endoglucanase
MPVPELLRRLLTTPGPSGLEADAAAVWREAASEFAEVSPGMHGSSIARVPGTAGGPTLALFGHMDEIGLIVTHVDDEGYVSVRPIGGWNPEVLVAQRVHVLTRDGPLPGLVVAKRDPARWEEKKRLEIRDLFVDVGARTKDEARGLLRIGDLAVVAVEPLELPNGRVASRALDDRLGAYVALEAARRVAEAGGAPGDVVAVATVQEEVGDFAGARTSAYALEPDVALALDVTPTTDAPGGDPKEGGETKLDDGAALSRGPSIDPRVFDLLHETAEAEGIPFSVDVSRGETHTDADAVWLSRLGIPTGVVSIPTRHLHTPNELCALADVEACIALVAAFAQRLTPDVAGPR